MMYSKAPAARPGSLSSSKTQQGRSIDRPQTFIDQLRRPPHCDYCRHRHRKLLRTHPQQRWLNRDQAQLDQQPLRLLHLQPQPVDRGTRHRMALAPVQTIHPALQGSNLLPTNRSQPQQILGRLQIDTQRLPSLLLFKTFFQGW